MAYLGGANSTNLLPGRGLINPAFVIKIVPATDALQQRKGQGRDNPNDDYLSNCKAGDYVDTKVKGKDISGMIERIIKNSIGDVTYVIIKDSHGETYKVGATKIVPRKVFSNPEDAEHTSSPALFAESRFFSYSQFINI
jgi:hypothetical protein